MPFQQATKIVSKREVNVIILGLIFMVLFSGFFTLSNLEKVLLTSTHQDNPEYTGDGFISLSILYIVFAVSIWIVPSLLAVAGPKVTLVIGTLGYSAFTASFYAENATLLYLGSICNGFGAALLWSGQGHYMVLNSTPETIQKLSAIFAIIAQSAMLYGNLVVYFVFQNKTHIDRGTRTLVLTVLLGFSLCSFVLAMLLPPPVPQSDTKNLSEKEIPEEISVGPFEALKKSISLVKDKNMILLITVFINAGFAITFVSGVYGPCVGFTLQLGNSKELVPLTGFFSGLGEIIACILLITTSAKLSNWRFSGYLIMLIVFVLQLISLSLIYINIPNSALLGDTMDIAYIKPSTTIALLCATLLGAADGTFLAMILTIIGKLYPNDSAQAIPIYIFFMSLSCAVSFFYSMFLSLHVQLLILMLFTTVSAISYSIVSKRHFDSILQSSKSPLTT